MKLTIIIIHYGKVARTEECLVKLAKKIDQHQLILINNTQDDIKALTKIIPGTELIDNRANTGFAKAANQGITLGLANKSVTHVMLMNNDLEIAIGTLDELLTTFVRDKSAGIVTPILHHQGGYDWGGVYSPISGMVKHANWDNKPKTILSVQHVAGAAMLISREVVDKIGMLDERFFLYYEDLDFCLRAQRAGYTIRINPSVVAEHTTSAGSSLVRRTLHQWRSHLLFVAKHMPRTALPTAILWDLLVYPLMTLKALATQ